ncbi:hypothetical protein ACE6H2_026594 [Prunus campanulata]
MDEENYENPYQFDPWRWEVFYGLFYVLGDLFYAHFTGFLWQYGPMVKFLFHLILFVYNLSFFLIFLSF